MKPTLFEKRDIHVHVPEGATPTDGPSAGIAMATSIVSILTSIPVRRDVAMTGEVTLRGDILPIGGVKEKVLAARAAQINTIIMPKLNERDLLEVPEALKRDVKFHFVEHIEDVLEIALLDGAPAPTAAPVSHGIPKFNPDASGVRAPPSAPDTIPPAAPMPTASK